MSAAPRLRPAGGPTDAVAVPRRVFHAGHLSGYAPDMQSDPDRVVARKREAPFEVRFVAQAGTVATFEGPVQVAPGDAVVTGPHGEEWPVSGDRFALKYTPLAPTEPGQDGTYLSRPLDVLALRIDTPFEVRLADAAGSRLQGNPGDWLLDYGDGSFGIVFAAAFDLLYTLDRGDAPPRE